MYVCMYVCVCCELPLLLSVCSLLLSSRAFLLSPMSLLLYPLLLSSFLLFSLSTVPLFPSIVLFSLPTSPSLSTGLLSSTSLPDCSFNPSSSLPDFVSLPRAPSSWMDIRGSQRWFNLWVKLWLWLHWARYSMSLMQYRQWNYVDLT